MSREEAGFDFGPEFFRLTDVDVANGETVAQVIGVLEDVGNSELISYQVFLQLDDPVVADFTIKCNGTALVTLGDTDYYKAAQGQKSCAELAGVATTAAPDDRYDLTFTVNVTTAAEAAVVKEATVAVLRVGAPSEVAG